MSTPDPQLTRYLLGELPESEATAFEREYFENPEVFARLLEAETTLVDDYVRKQLPLSLRQRFESHYLADPRRRARVEYASALSAKIGNTAPTAGEARPRGFLSPFGSGWLMRFSTAAAFAVVIVSTALLWQQSRRLRADLARGEAALTREAERTRDLQTQLSSAEAKSRELATQLQRSQPPATGQPFVSLLLTVPSARSPETRDAPTLTIPAGTREVRLQLAMEEAEHPSYQVKVSPIGGAPLFTRAGVVPQRTGSGTRLDVSMDAEGLAPGDYMLTLSGERPGRPADAVSQLLFRIVTTPRQR